MNEVMKFLGDVNTPVALATLDNNQPRVRFLSFKMLEDDKLYFITSKKKSIYKELLENPNIEICSLPSQEKEWVRVSGKVTFIRDIELNKKAFELLPILVNAYQTPENEDIILLRIDDMDARKFSILGTMERL